MTLPNTLTNGTLPDADDVMENFDYLDANTTAITEWVAIETLTFAGDTTKTTAGTITVYKSYRLTFDNMIVSTNGDISIRVNGDSAGDYSNKKASTTGVSTTNSDAEWQISSEAEYNISGDVIVSGKSGAVSGGKLTLQGGGIGGASSKGLLAGTKVLGNAVQITSFTVFVASGTVTGQVKVWGRN